MAKNYPVMRRVYKYAELIQLDLPDSPALNIRINNRLHPIQIGHVTHEQLLENQEFADSFWEYSGTTHEDIPIFKYVGHVDPTKLVDHEPYLSPFGLGRGDGLWVTPKGFPRAQR